MASDAVATFGDLLRRARHAAALSQEELAARAGLSTRGISDLERGIIRTPRKDTLDMLAAGLSLSDDERRRWERARRHADEAPPHTSETRRPRARLPTRLTTFIGRQQEIADLSDMLSRQDQRLVTITGPGGIGKTSLAIQVSSNVDGKYRDGVCFVSLAPVRDPAFVATAISTALGLQERGSRDPRETLTTYLFEKHLLLVLDNFEQVIDAGPLVTELLLACPALTVLTTSRTSLHLDGEQEFPISPLGIPRPGQRPSLQQLTQHEAVDLFVQRARLHRPDFQLATDNMDAVIEICRRLDGLPLAIELVATRIKLLSPPDLLTRLGQRLPLLTGGPRNLPVRQQTMQDTIAWSYDLLNADHQQLFRYLSVFAGGWTLDAAEGVCGEDSSHGRTSAVNVLDGLSALVDQSLVQQIEHHDASRFMMLEMVREYGRNRLEEQPESDTIRERHAAYFLAAAEAAAPHLDGGDPVPYLNQLEADHDNLRAALAWLRETVDTERGLVMVGYLREFWYIRGHLSEGRAQADIFLKLPGATTPTHGRAMALATAAWLALWQGSDNAIVHAEEALAIWRTVGDETHVPFLLITLGLAVDHFRGDMEQARSLNVQSLEMARAIGDARSIAMSLHNLGAYAWRCGDKARAMALNEESMTVARDAGNLQTFALALGGLGYFALVDNELDRASELLQQRLRLYSNLADTWGIVRTLDYLAAIAVARKQAEPALRLLASAATLRNRTGIMRSPNDRAYLDSVDAELVTMYGEAAFQSAWAQARTLPPDDVIRDVLEAEPFAAPPPAPNYPDHLTKREVEVLRLIATGHSNRQIADILFLSPRTIERHIANVYLKIDVHTKAEATAYAQRQQRV